jgi:hypothetical protein
VPQKIVIFVVTAVSTSNYCTLLPGCEDGNNRFLRNVGKFLPDYTTLRARR